MPQFEPTYFISQVFWLFIFTGVLYWGLIKRAVPNVEKAFNLRAEKIEGRRKEAELIRLEAEKLKNTLENDLINARNEANEMINTALQENSVMNAHRRNEFIALLKERIVVAEESIKMKKEEALKDLHSIALETSVHIVEKLSGKSIKEEEILKHFDKVLKDSHTINDDAKKVTHA